MATAEFESLQPLILDIHDLQDEVGLSGSTVRVQEVPEKIEEFVGLFDQVVSEAALQESGVFELVADDVDPTLLFAATGRLGTADAVDGVRVLDPLSGNTLSLDPTGRIEHGNTKAGVIKLSLGKGQTTGGITVTPLEADVSEKVSKRARVPVSLMRGKGFIPDLAEMPVVMFTGDPERVLKEGEVVQIGPGVPGIAGLAAAMRLFRLRGPGAIEVDSGLNGLSRIIAPSIGRNAGRLALGGPSF